MSYFISFIIPVYNVGPERLRRCLTSVADAVMSVPSINFEVIIVDDASPKWADESRVINLHPALKKLKPRIGFTVIKHTVNKGLGAARNTGLDASTGKYIWFVDSDDCINAKVFKEIVLTVGYHADYDIVQLGATRVSPDCYGTSMYFNSPSDHIIHLTGGILNKRELIPPCVWSKIYKSEFLKSNNLRFPEGVLYEDQEFLVRCALLNPFVAVLPVNAYYYYDSPNSIMTSTWDEKHILDAYKVIETCTKLLHESNLDSSDYSERLKEYQLTIDKARIALSELPFWRRLKCAIKVFRIQYHG